MTHTAKYIQNCHRSVILTFAKHIVCIQPFSMQYFSTKYNFMILKRFPVKSGNVKYDWWTDDQQQANSSLHGNRRERINMLCYRVINLISIVIFKVAKNTGSRSTDHPPFSNFLFTNLFSITFLYFYIISINQGGWRIFAHGTLLWNI